MSNEQDRTHKWQKKQERQSKSGSDPEIQQRKRRLRHQTYQDRKAKQELDDAGIPTTRTNRMQRKRSNSLKLRGK